MFPALNLTVNAINLITRKTGLSVQQVVKVERFANGAFLVIAVLSNGKKFVRFVSLIALLRACPSECGYYVRVYGELREIRQIAGFWFHSSAPKYFRFKSAWECIQHLIQRIARKIAIAA